MVRDVNEAIETFSLLGWHLVYDQKEMIQRDKRWISSRIVKMAGKDKPMIEFVEYAKVPAGVFHFAFDGQPPEGICKYATHSYKGQPFDQSLESVFVEFPDSYYLEFVWKK